MIGKLHVPLARQAKASTLFCVPGSNPDNSQDNGLELATILQLILPSRTRYCVTPLLSRAGVIVAVTLVVENGLTVTLAGPEALYKCAFTSKRASWQQGNLTHAEVWSRNFSPLQLHNRVGQEGMPSLQRYIDALTVGQSTDTLRAAHQKV